jgi:hypothetical protein
MPQYMNGGGEALAAAAARLKDSIYSRSGAVD